MEFFYLILGAGIGYMIRPAMCFYANYQWYSNNTTMPFERLVKRSLKDIWS